MHLDPAGLKLVEYRGTLSLVGPSLSTAYAHFVGGEPPLSLHITLLTAAERKRLPNPPNPTASVSLDNIYAAGVNSSGHVRWVVILWNHGDAFRASLKLPRKQYHMTLTENDDHAADKGLDALVRAVGHEAVVQELGGEAGLDHAVVAADEGYLKLHLAEQLILASPDSYKGYARLASASDTHPKLAALSYARAVSLNPSLLPTITKQIVKLRDAVPYGGLITAEERQALPPALLPHLLHPWPRELSDALSHTLWTAETAKRTRQVSLDTATAEALPRFFSWLYPHRLAGMSTPRRAADIEMLADMGFSHVLSLTEEEPLPESWFPPTVEHVFIPIPNYGAPTLQEMDVVYSRVREGGVWLVHCGGGVGRAGTVLACLVAMFGRGGEDQGEGEGEEKPQLDARTAIGLVRRARPSSLETEQQESFVARWVSHRWKYRPDTHVEPVTSLVSIGDVRTPTKAIVLIGRPGSGKSWLAAAISKRRTKPTIVVSQDESDGGRAACERAVARCSSLADGTLLILDRCNPTSKERSTWLRLLGCPAMAVYFDYPAAICSARLDARIGHPTLRAGRGRNALEQMDALMSPPTLREGWAGILTVSSFAAARDAVLRLTGDVPLLKFPRTPHLLNLGAATPDDLISSSREVVELRGRVTIEEKIDGANMGISLDWSGVIRVQNRSHWVSSADAPQFRPLDAWIAANDASLRAILGRDQHFPERYVLYGEWMVATHSVKYTSLPGPFVAFDLYDRAEGSFASRRVLAATLRGSGIPLTPLIGEEGEGGSVRRLGRKEIGEMLARPSAFSPGERVEGVYIRTEDEGRLRTLGRGKIVRGDFIAGNAHWTRGPLELNKFEQRWDEG